VTVIPRRASDPALLGVDGDQRAAGLHRFAEKGPKDLFLTAILGRMLLPDERVPSHGKESIEILSSKRPECEEFACQNGLEIECHAQGRPGTLNVRFYQV